MCVEIAQDLPAWKRKMDKGVVTVVKQIEIATIRLCQDVHQSIESSNLPGLLKQIALKEWNQKKAEILKEPSRAEKLQRREVANTERYARTEIDIRCIISVLIAGT